MDIIQISKGAKSLASISKIAIEKWSKYRSEQFFTALQYGLQIEQATGQQNEDVDEALDKLLKDEQSSELIFDAYRRVCYSKAKDYGPRVIALLTVELMNECRTSEASEEMIFSAAENLGDLDFVNFAKNYEDLLSKLKSYESEPMAERHVFESCDEITYNNFEERYEQLTGKGGKETQMSLPDIREVFGIWAAVLRDCGLLHESLASSTLYIEEDSERNIHHDTTLFRQTVSYVYKSEVKKLYDLYLRSRKVNEE